MNEVKKAFRTITTETGNEVLSAPLFFGFASRKIVSFLVDGRSQFSDGRNLLHYGFRYDQYSDFGHHISPRLGLVRKLGESSVVKFLYGHAFRAQTGNELFGAPFVVGNQDLDPETIDTYELVYLRQGDSSRFEATLFENRWDDTIIISARKYANITSSRSYGVELSYDRRMGKWDLNLNGSYVESKNETDDLDFVVFPKYILNLDVAYTFNDKWTIQLRNRILLSMSKHPDTVDVISKKLKNYWRLDISGTRHFGEHELFANIRNVLNRNNQLPSTFDAPAQSRDRFIGGLEDEGINVVIGFRYKMSNNER